MKEIIKKIGSYAFYLGIVLETLFVIVDKSEYVLQHPTALFRFTFLLFCIKIATTKYSKCEWLGMVLLAIMGTVSWYITDREDVIRIIVFVLASKDIEIRKVIKIILFETLAGIAILMLLAFMGVLGEVSLTGQFRGGGLTITRYCFGLGHPNAFHCMVTMVIGLAMAIYDRKMKWWSYGCFMIINIVVMKFTDSRTGFLILTGIIMIALMMHYLPLAQKKNAKVLMGEIILAVTVGFSLFSVFVAYDANSFLFRLNEILNGRTEWAYKDGGIQYWHLFSTVDNQTYFDMGFVRMAYWYGTIPSLVFIVLLAIAIWNCKKNADYDLLLIMLTMILYTLMEAHAVSDYIGRNYTYICMGYLLPLTFGNKEKELSLIDIPGKVIHGRTV